MPVRLELIIGSGDAVAIPPSVLRSAASALAAATPGALLWVVADQRQAEAATERLSQLAPAMLAPGVKSLAQAADAVVASAPKILRPLSRVQQHRLIQQVLAQGGPKRFPAWHAAARTAGGLDLVAQAFRALGHADVQREDAFQPTGEGFMPGAAELARVYLDYRVLLSKHQLVDRESRMQAACEHLESTDKNFTAFDRVLVTGIDSPSPLELRLITALLQAATHGVVAIPTAPGEEQPNAESRVPSPWTGPRQMLAHLQAQFQDVVITKAKGQLGKQKHAALSRLFSEHISAAAPAEQPPEGLRVIAAGSAQEEVELAARRAKRLLLSGERPDEIVIACRNLRATAPRLKQAFAKLGVPLAVEGASPLSGTAWARSAALLIRLAAGDWRHADLLTVVSRPQFGAFSTKVEDQQLWTACRRMGFSNRRAATEWLLRELLYPRGRQELLRRVQWHAEHLREDTQQPDRDATDAVSRSDRRGVAATLALAPLTTLSNLCEGFRESALPLEWCDRLKEGLAQLGYASPERGVADDQAARAALEEGFASLTKLDAWLGQEAVSLSLPEVNDLIRAWLPRVSLEERWRHEGRVRALTAETAAGAACRRLLLIGLDEQSFPRAESLPLPVTEQENRRRQSDEMLLFTKLLNAAEVTTTLSYTEVDARAQKLNPSPFVNELEQLFAPGALRAEEPRYDVLCADDARHAAVEGLLHSLPRTMSALLRDEGLGVSARGLCAGLVAGFHRSHGPRFGVYEGLLSSESALKLLEQRYGPEHLWSASQLENYAECPFKFYLRNVVRAAPLGSLELEVDYRRRGSLLHDAMGRFHRRVRELVQEGQATSSVDPDAFSQSFRDAVYQSLAAIATAPHENAVATVEAMQATAWGEKYREQHKKYDRAASSFDQPLLPSHFEARFGPGAVDDASELDPLSTPEPFTFRADGLTVLLTGQVDRIDVGRIGEQIVFNVVDYKTAKSMTVRQNEIEDGRLLQLVLYAIAVGEHLLTDQNATPLQVGYWLVQKNGYQFGKAPQPGEVSGGRVTLNEEWSALVETVRKRVAEIVRGVRAAQFPMLNLDEDCTGRCEYRTVCRVAQTRSLQKTLAIREDNQ